ncbi:MAG: methionine biosynthesis protein MetW, partial [Sphingopyxis sp.]|nr:methionine biosynthesis protein MetW [Sphingopyxis sp.]
FRALIKERGIMIEAQWFLSGEKQRSASAANLLADHAVFLLRRVT